MSCTLKGTDGVCLQELTRRILETTTKGKAFVARDVATHRTLSDSPSKLLTALDYQGEASRSEIQ